VGPYAKTPIEFPDLTLHKRAKSAVRQVYDHLPANSFVFRTDVKSYYASIDHVALIDRLARHIKDNAILDLLVQYMRRTSERGGWFWEFERGISLGCPLSPLMGAFFLHELDERLARSGLFYVRFMDDILVLAPSRWKLRGAIKAVNEVLQSLWLEKSPDKTSIGKIERGFDFLGYHFSHEGLRAAKATIQKFVERVSRLYEQEREGRVSPSALGNYVRCWNGWLKSGLECLSTLRQPLFPPLTHDAEADQAKAQ
jgi:RNA-directed DNA polymerase